MILNIDTRFIQSKMQVTNKTFHTSSNFRQRDNKENVERGGNDDMNCLKYMHYKMTPRKTESQ